MAFALLFTARRPRQWILGGVLASVGVLCRLNHLLAALGYLAVFVRWRWRAWPKTVLLTIGLALAMLTLPPIHNRYYGGPSTGALRIMNVNRAATFVGKSAAAPIWVDIINDADAIATIGISGMEPRLVLPRILHAEVNQTSVSLCRIIKKIETVTIWSQDQLTAKNLGRSDVLCGEIEEEACHPR